jgi:hypothetical protein
MSGGRPLKFKTVAELQKKIDKFFKECDIKSDPYTITGLALALDTTRETLMDYQEREEYSDAIKKAKLRCQNYAERMLYKIRPTGPIFALKNYGWKDENTTTVVLPKPIQDVYEDQRNAEGQSPHEAD